MTSPYRLARAAVCLACGRKHPTGARVLYLYETPTGPGILCPGQRCLRRYNGCDPAREVAQAQCS